MALSPTHDLVVRAMAAVTAKDLDTSLALFTEDAVFFDPHYPVQKMVGKAAIKDGLIWGFGGMEKFQFDIDHYFESEDGKSASIETSCHHVLKGGRSLDFPQVFVIETRDGLVSRMQAYEPYGPGGIVGVFLGVQRLIHGRKR